MGLFSSSSSGGSSANKASAGAAKSSTQGAPLKASASKPADIFSFDLASAAAPAGSTPSMSQSSKRASQPDLSYGRSPSNMSIASNAGQAQGSGAQAQRPNPAPQGRANNMTGPVNLAPPGVGQKKAQQSSSSARSSPSQQDFSSFDDFDPLTPKSTGAAPASAKPVAKAPAQSSSRSAAAPRTEQGSFEAPAVISGDADAEWDGNRQPGEARRRPKYKAIIKTPEQLEAEDADYQRTKKPGQTKDDWLIEKKRKETLDDFQKQAQKEQEEKAAKDDASWRLQDTIKNWEYKNGVQKNIRSLLSSLHSVLWAGSGWNQLSVADLMDKSQIKKAYRQAVMVIHPDKLPQSATPDQKVIAKAAFEAITTAWRKFEDNPNSI